MDPALYVAVIAPPLTTRDRSAADNVPLHGDQRKQVFYQSTLGRTVSGDTQIIPLAFSALGRPSPLGLETIYSIARHLGNGSDHKTSQISHRIFQVISVQLYRGNSGILRAYRQLSHPNQ